MLSYEDAYQAIKNLEADGSALPLPPPTATVHVGSIDQKTGNVTYAVQTFVQTIALPAATQPGLPSLPTHLEAVMHETRVGDGGLSGTEGGPGVVNPGNPTQPPPPSPPVQITVAVVQTDAVNLTVSFDVINAPSTGFTEKLHENKVSSAVDAGGMVPTGTTGNVTITEYPTTTWGSRIFVNVGLATSSMGDTPYVDPPLSTVPLQLSVNGQISFIHLAILRPPVLGLGAFTMPALPVAIVFAPPQGALKKNSNALNDKLTITRSMTTSYTSSTQTKTAPAYQTSDILAKIADLATAASVLVGGWPAIAVAVGLAAASSSSTTSSSTTDGKNQSTDLTTSDALKDFSSVAKAVSDVLSGFGDQGASSGQTTVTVETDNTFSLAVTQSDTYGSEQGAGPGVGDRFIYLRNVRAIWFNLNGDVGMTILGYDGVLAYAASDLIGDLESLNGGGQATTTGLDVQTLQTLLDLDPYYLLSKRRDSAAVGPPLVGPPRFTPASPPGRAGDGSLSTGDVFSQSNETISETKTVNTNQTVSVTDVKPGWIDVIFGADNTETTTTLTITNGATVDDKSDETITNTITMVSQGDGDTYDIQIYYDQLFGTIVPVPTDSLVLQGVPTPVEVSP